MPEPLMRFVGDRNGWQVWESRDNGLTWSLVKVVPVSKLYR